MTTSPLIYPNDPGFWELLSGNIDGVTRQSLPSTNTLIVFCDPLTGRIKVGTEEDLPDYQNADQSDEDYQNWFYG